MIKRMRMRCLLELGVRKEPCSDKDDARKL